MDELERIWGALLSGDPAQIKNAYIELTDDEARSVTAHLKKMIDEAGYSKAQKEAARQARAVIEAHD